ncbi:hypothetical protein [Pseudonocardia acaciae]|uniref:hypothetical protein n=1 Tax=Pseudonocardia acaciae TaxID=551276 RepID=UPI0004913CD3|nr:hypothetical protein [Pseudonocardia acaciae]
MILGILVCLLVAGSVALVVSLTPGKVSVVRAIVPVVVLSVALTACSFRVGSGSGADTARFDIPGYNFTFEYPKSFVMSEDVRIEKSVGGDRHTKNVAVALDNSNMIMATRRLLRRDVTKESLASVRPELDKVITELATGNFDPGKEIEIGGFPGFEYQIPFGDKQSRYIVFFDGAVQYTLNCQSTTQHRTEIADACRTVEHTLRRRGAETARFDLPGHNFTFEYPKAWSTTEDVNADGTAQTGPSGSGQKRVALLLDGSNMMIISRTHLSGDVTKENIASIQPEQDGNMAELAGSNVGPGKPIELSGFPGLEYQVPFADVHSRYLIFFDGAVKYTLDCQSTEQHRAEITNACQTAEHTLQRRGAENTRFDEAGYNFTFEYPKAFTKTEKGPAESGAKDITLALDDFHVISIHRGNVDHDVTKENMASAQSEFDSRATKAFGPLTAPGKLIELGGFPGLEYQASIANEQIRMIILFDGRVFYAIDCRSAGRHGAEINDAFQAMQRTLRHR